MQNDSIETLLLRHYGSAAPAPVELEERLQRSLYRQVAELQHEQHIATHLQTYRLNRRRAIHLMALGTAGLGVLSAGLASLHTLEMALTGQDVTQYAST